MIGLVRPVAIVIARNGFLAAVARCRAVDIDNGNDVDLAFLAQRFGPAVIAGKPLDEAATDPARARFPGVLASLNPDRRSLVIGQIAALDPQGRAGPAAAGPGQLECLSPLSPVGNLLDQCVSLFGCERRAPREPDALGLGLDDIHAAPFAD